MERRQEIELDRVGASGLVCHRNWSNCVSQQDRLHASLVLSRNRPGGNSGTTTAPVAMAPKVATT